MNLQYPLYLRLEGEMCLVVGGGKVALRKVESLLKSGAKVHVVSPQLHNKLKSLGNQGKIICWQREYQETDLKDMFLVIAATDNAVVNGMVAEQCLKTKRLVNVVDNPQKGNFTVPAVVRRGKLSIAVSTGGNSPMLASGIRKKLEKTFGQEYADFIELLGQVRLNLLQDEPDPEKRREVLERIVQSDILILFKEKRYDEIKERVEDAYRGSGS